MFIDRYQLGNGEFAQGKFHKAENSTARLLNLIHYYGDGLNEIPFQFIPNYFLLSIMKCPALGLSGFSAPLENRPDQSPQMKPIRQRSQHPFPKSQRLHSCYVRSNFRNGRSLRPSSTNLIRSVELELWRLSET